LLDSLLQEINYQVTMTVTMAGSQFSEATGRDWKESLRPLSPGRDGLTKTKSSRSNSIASSRSRRTRSRSMSPSRLLATTVSSRAKERDAIRFEYKKRSKPTVPAARSRAKSVSPTREISQRKPARASSLPRDDGGEGDRTPMTWNAPSVLSWSGTPDREHRADSQYRSLYHDMETKKNNHQEQDMKTSVTRQHHQSRIANHVTRDTAKTILVNQNTESVKKPRRDTLRNTNTESRQIQQRQILDQEQSNIQADKKQQRCFEQGLKRKEETNLMRERKLEDWTKYSGRENTTTTGENGTPIPVKNYRSPHSSSSLPTERQERDNKSFEKRNRRKSLSTYSKTSTASRNFGGCIIS